TSSDPADNFVEENDGGIAPLLISGGSGSGIALQQDFVIPAAQASSFIIDIDLRQSVRSPSNAPIYRLNPVMRLAMSGMTGGIRGEVDSSKLTATPPACSDTQVGTYNAVYVFEGHDVKPDDINQLGNNTEPFATTAITYDGASGKYLYEAAFLPAGNYTVAVTCNANLDDLEADDNLQFFDIRNVTVVKNNIIFL
ncbi:MAG: DUF4382 domain-containing protein, partial [Gammaproteobacteria bacterium]|nr:DUF4382 domain-containing protein [Gammaproteobacteria bacterium]